MRLEVCQVREKASKTSLILILNVPWLRLLDCLSTCLKILRIPTSCNLDPKRRGHVMKCNEICKGAKNIRGQPTIV
jgi:hypothetical protein